MFSWYQADKVFQKWKDVSTLMMVLSAFHYIILCNQSKYTQPVESSQYSAIFHVRSMRLFE